MEDSVRYMRHKVYGFVLGVDRLVDDDRVLFVGHAVAQPVDWYEEATKEEYLQKNRKITKEWFEGVLNEYRHVTVPRHARLWCRYRRKRDLMYFKHQRKRYKMAIRIVTRRVKDKITLGSNQRSKC